MVIISSTFIITGFSQNVAAMPYSGNPSTPTNLTFYFHNVSTPVTVGSQQHLHIADTWNDTVAAHRDTGQNISSIHYLSVNFTVYPQLAGPLHVNGTVFVWIYLSQNGSAPTSGHVTLTLYEISPAGTSASLGSGPSASTNVNYPGTGPTAFLVTGPTVNTTVPTNYSLAFNIVINGGTSQLYGAYWGNIKGTYYYSRAVIPASSYLMVEGMNAISNGKTVYSLSQQSQNKTVEIIANITDPLGEYDFASFPVDYQIVNNTAIVASGVMSPVQPYSFNSFMRQYMFSFNYTGYIPGPIKIIVNATDNTMHNFLNSQGSLYGRNAFGSMELYVGTPPLKVTFSVTDAAGNPLSGAELLVYAGLGFVASNVSNAGRAGFMLSQGDYTVKAIWEEVMVNSVSISVTNNSTDFTLRLSVYSPEFVFEGMNNQPLPAAQLQMVSPAGIRMPVMFADQNATISFSDIPAGNYPAEIFWHATEVFNGTITVGSNGKIVINVDAYNQAFSIVDQSGAPVAAANVIVVNMSDGVYEGFNTSNASGMALTTLPYGVYEIQVYWKGILVYSATNVKLDDPTAGPMLLSTEIYTVNIKAVSASGSPLQNVIVTVYSSSTGTFLSAVTGSSGNATFTLAGGNYTLTASFSTTYDLSAVNQKIVEPISISSSTAMTLRFTKVYPPFTSTNLFLLILAIVIVIAAAAILVSIAMMKYRKK